MYELVGKLSRAFSSSAFAARIIAADVLGRVVSVGEPGFMGSGGGARSGSALSHLERGQSRVDDAPRRAERVWKTYMGMVLSMEENEDPWWRTSSRSWECSRSIEDIASGLN